MTNGQDTMEPHLGGAFFQSFQRQCEVIFQSIQTLEVPVMKELLAQLIPDMLNRAELDRIGRQREHVDICWRFEHVAAMPACPVDDHNETSRT
jgi:hypothetical protein